MKRIAMIAAAAAVAASAAWAQPGFFYLYKQENNPANTVCQPESWGAPGWIAAEGPFEDSDCEIPVKK